MKAETKSVEKNSQTTKLDLRGKLGNKLDIKQKLDLDEKVGDMGIAVPSANMGEYVRVLKLARKPSREEFTMVAKVSMAGIGAIGVLGFIIYALLTELPKVF
jgi:protein transport protein SEC61 subunit gamma-like protein